jgi:hypothetical protein
MAITDTYSYTLQSCDVGSYPDVTGLCNPVTVHPLDGQIVYVNQTWLNPATSPPIIETVEQRRTYLLVNNGLNADVCSNWLPILGSTVLTSCADANIDKLFRLKSCANPEEFREVLLAANYASGTVLRFVGECTCWKVIEIIANYTDNPTVSNSFSDCTSCLVEVTDELCLYEERTIGYAISLEFPKTEPIDRNFAECCYSNTVFGDLSDTDAYKNDYTSVFYKRQAPSDTVSYQLIGVSTGTTNLVNSTHGIELAFGNTEQPDLSYFKVEWRKILSLLGEDIYTIRKVIVMGGIPINVDSLVTYNLTSFSQAKADNTVRIDWTMDGKLEKINTNFKNSDYVNSVRVQGYFGDRKSKIEQDNIVYGSKKGQSYYDDQITMSNSYEYLFKAYNIPECVVRPIYNEGIFGNEIFISDYNKNNHSYLYELSPVILVDDNGLEYNVDGRGVNINLTFGDRTKDNRKTNC